MGKRMEPHDFKKWRKTLGLSQKDAAEALGLKRRMIQYYESGERDGEEVKIPQSVALACYAVAEGVATYRGPVKKIEWRDDARQQAETKSDDKAAAKPAREKQNA